MRKSLLLLSCVALVLQGCGGSPKSKTTEGETKTDAASLGAVVEGEVKAVNTDLSGYELVWSDEFDGTELSDVWNLEEGYIANNELQDYQKSGNHVISDGTLKITAKKINDDKKFGSYTSARMNTKGNKAFTYGKIEARIKLPMGNGVWPAFWTLGENIHQGARWPACGEIDIMEYVGYEPRTTHATLHSQDFNHGKGTQRGNKAELLSGEVSDWHVYGMIWTEAGIDIYVDSTDNVIFSCEANEPRTVSAWPFDAPHFLILNLAIGGDWGGAQGIDNSVYPAVMEVDYVRVYQKQ